jgi:hypothetical protein
MKEGPRVIICKMVRQKTRFPAHLDLLEEAAVGRDAVPAVLDEVEGLFPVDVVMLHHIHDCERR